MEIKNIARWSTLLFIALLPRNGFAIERFAIGHSSQSGFSCQESTQKAHSACMTWLSETTSALEVIEEPRCPLNLCTCSGGGIPQSTCLGYALYEDKLPCPGARERIQYATTSATGFGCPDAQHKAITELYHKAGAFAEANRVYSFRIRECTCAGGNISNASCGGTLTYHVCD